MAWDKREVYRGCKIGNSSMKVSNYLPLCTDPSGPWLGLMSPFSMTGSLGSTAEGREGASLSQPVGGRRAWRLEPRDRRAALLYCT